MTYQYDTKYNSPNYTPNAKVAAVFGRPRTIDGIVIHHWGIDGQTHQGVVDFFCRKGGTSAHYVASAGRVTCLVADNNAAWHAGNATANATKIGIECRPEMSDADFETVAQLIADLRDTHGDLPLTPHKQWKNTACPGRWEAQLKRLSARADELRKKKGTAAKPSTPAVKPKPAESTQRTLSKGDSGDDVRRLQAGLNRVFPSYSKFAGNGDGKFGPYTVQVIKEFQRRTGLDDDGVVGPKTIKKLATYGITL